MGQNKDLDKRLLQLVEGANVDSARQALREGADPHARRDDGRTGLHLAVAHGEYYYNNQGRELMSMFLNRGVDINTGDKQGVTALHIAALDEGYVCRAKVEDLLNFGANLEARDRQGQTPLHHAAHRGKKTDSLKVLLENGAEVNARDEAGVTPLHLAAARGESDAIKILLNAKADIHATTRDGKHVWDFAVDAGKDYQAQWLKAEAEKQLRLARQKEAEETRRREQELESERRKKEQDKPADPWSLLSPERVALSTTDRQIGYKITEIFNFSARTYTQITQNLSTKSEASAVRTFDEFTDKTAIERALCALNRLGGHADPASVNSAVVEKPRKGLSLPKTSGSP